jgi:hypothetical protein
VVTAAPWAKVTRLTAVDGTTLELPGERVTPLRLWVPPGPHRAELVLPDGDVATCEVDVVAGATQLCRAMAPAPAAAAAHVDYFKQVGWWR